MIKLKLAIREVAQKRGLKTAYQLQRKLNTYPATASRFWKSDEMRLVSLDTLEDLCNALECDVTELIVEDKPPAKPAKK